MCLPVAVHLQPVFNRSQCFISAAERFGLAGFDPSRIAQNGQCCTRIGNAQFGITSAVDQLMRLRKKLALPNSAMPSLDVKAGAKRLPLAVMSPDLRGHRGNIFQLAEIERLAPDKRLDSVEKIVAQCPVASAHP